MKLKFFLLCVVWALLFPAGLRGQEEADVPALRFSIGGGYMLGGQFFSESFTYNPAFGGELAVYRPLSSTINVGLGAGVDLLLLEEHFVPVFASFMGFTKPERSCTYFLINAGYAWGWRRDYADLGDYDFEGGMFFKSGLGKRFMLGSRSFLVGVALHHQWARGVFDNGFGTEYKEALNYDWLAFELRFFY